MKIEGKTLPAGGGHHSMAGFQMGCSDGGGKILVLASGARQPSDPGYQNSRISEFRP